MKKKILIGGLALLLCGTVLAWIFCIGNSQAHINPAIGNLRTVLGAENAYYSAKGVYGTFDALTQGNPPVLDGKWDGVKNDYRIALTITADGQHFKALAVPDKPDKKHNRRYCVDESGVIRVTTDGSEPNKGWTPLGE
jgi:hypothetical protein